MMGMTKYHITKSGQAALCTASDRACPLGGEHYDSMKEAAVAKMSATAVGDAARTPEDLTVKHLAQSLSVEEKKALVEDLARHLLDEHGLTSQGWRFRWDNRSIKRVGVCRYRERTVEFSSRRLEATTPAGLEDTVRHEVAHAIAGWGAGHGYEWQRKAVELGANPSAYASADEYDPDELPYRWVGVCPRNPEHKIRRDSHPRGLGSCSRCGEGKFDKDLLIVWQSNDGRPLSSAFRAAIQRIHPDGWPPAAPPNISTEDVVNSETGRCERHYYGAKVRDPGDSSAPDPEFIEALKKMYLAKFGVHPDEDGVDAGTLLAMFNKGELG